MQPQVLSGHHGQGSVYIFHPVIDGPVEERYFSETESETSSEIRKKVTAFGESVPVILRGEEPTPRQAIAAEDWL